MKTREKLVLLVLLVVGAGVVFLGTGGCESSASDGCDRVRVQATGVWESHVVGDDGHHQKGATCSSGEVAESEAPELDAAATSQRFTDNGNGTMTDNQTSLIWLKNANCWGVQDWPSAIENCNALAAPQCDLSDNSVAGDWRLPNIREMFSLLDYSQTDPALPSGHPFLGVQSHDYWSSTTRAVNTSEAWAVFVFDGVVYPFDKGDTQYVWPVRGGQ